MTTLRKRLVGVAQYLTAVAVLTGAAGLGIWLWWLASGRAG